MLKKILLVTIAFLIALVLHEVKSNTLALQKIFDKTFKTQVPNRAVYVNTKYQTQPTPSGARATVAPMQKQITQAPRPKPNITWGVAKSLGNHLYSINIKQDTQMATEKELLSALNEYRKLHNVQELISSDELCRFADYRTQELYNLGKLDSHAGFTKYLQDADKSRHLSRFKVLGENNSLGYTLNATHLIEWVFDADEEHRNNQLNPGWNRTCIRIKGTLVEILFGQEL